ncbi:hypothetical protein CYMTET_3725 [Cymbomonas tetramitiformis]|uniref:Uncharacterized protein n=1 Tax=Cymbomonas tetramitiformis TaxID=36881 RepID=A0AAE0LKJ5_9CHLO|nr:hypothetical protein CYMTET_3725 [Cymbomonas tetramitiformis]
MLLHWSADCSHILEIKVSAKYQLLCSGWLPPLLEGLSLLCGWMEMYKLSARRKTTLKGAKERIPVEGVLDERPSLLDTPLVDPEECVSESSYESDSSMDSILSFTSCSSQLGATYASPPADTLSPLAPKSPYKGGGWLTPANNLSLRPSVARTYSVASTFKIFDIKVLMLLELCY